MLLVNTVASFLPNSEGTQLPDYLPESEIAKYICSAHGFPRFTTATTRPRKVYDLILLSTELSAGLRFACTLSHHMWISSS